MSEMNNLETRIRQHYTRELHPMVFELLDEVTLLRIERDHSTVMINGLTHEVERLKKIKAGDTAEFIRMDTALDELNAENERLRAAIEKFPENRESFHFTYNGGHEGEMNRAFHHGMDTVFNALDEWKSRALENPNA